ncbi:MAG: DUF2271 domain-containing protein [Bacteroidales bacterium]|nr:DUF2271 domain-containing protein [Bacteroidales bacterium]
MNKQFSLFAKMTIIMFIFILNFNSNAQTSGNLSFSLTVTEPSGGYNNKIVIAIWLEDSLTGNFVKTKMRYAVTEVQYLNVWIAKSGQNVVDAITGATTQPGQFSIIWNGTDVSGNVVPDGPYNVWIQFSDKNSSGPTKFCSFVKGPNAISGQTYPNSGNFTNMVLSWTPITASVQYNFNQNNPIYIYPNPARDNISISFNLLKDKPVDISVYNMKGQIVKHIASLIQADAGHNIMSWDATNDSFQKLPNGVYFIRISCNEFDKVAKIILL